MDSLSELEQLTDTADLMGIEDDVLEKVVKLGAVRSVNRSDSKGKAVREAELILADKEVDEVISSGRDAQLYYLLESFGLLTAESLLRQVMGRRLGYAELDEEVYLPSGPIPFDAESGGPNQENQVYDDVGRWIGLDQPAPARVITTMAAKAVPAREINHIFARYLRGDYGRGEAGFAIYQARSKELWLIDDAVRTPEGESPARDPGSSPGPQTLLLPDEY